MKHLVQTHAMSAALLAASLLPLGPSAWAQVSQTPDARSAALEAGYITRTFHLAAATNQAEQNEILTALRNIMLPSTKVFLAPSQNAIVVRGAPEQVQQAADLLKDLDHPHRQYRLTYTFTEIDGGKRIGVQRYSMVLAAGERMGLKEGSRVPIITGSYTKSDQSIEKQTTYLDVGFNFDSTVRDYSTGVQLMSRIEQSSMTTERSGIGPEDPIIRQTRLEGVSYLSEGKPLSLGTLDVLGSTRQLQVEALVEPVR